MTMKLNRKTYHIIQYLILVGLPIIFAFTFVVNPYIDKFERFIVYSCGISGYLFITSLMDIFNTKSMTTFIIFLFLKYTIIFFFNNWMFNIDKVGGLALNVGLTVWGLMAGYYFLGMSMN
ncbi:hypothetical protein [Bacillus sp. ISL-7]|uniref:hypothetical protein n=1 Tax=Bacillus sp. ISL-7 TaxID=2819136 RepID=UPI001BED380F|nr:hypothetical protein [Bacillus sp. ISL-7]MBT2739077.1 hypothetical protein [Bacillus sp. ISL-7]